MIDREKVIKGLECCAKDNCSINDTCPYGKEDASYCLERLSADALAMLKEQAEEIQEVRRENSRILNQFYEWAKENNAVRPVLEQDSMVCGNCGHEVIWQRLLGDNVWADEQLDYCPKCGRAVKWDA